MTGNARGYQLARSLLDRAHLAYLGGALDGHWSLTLPCQGHLLQHRAHTVALGLGEDRPALTTGASPSAIYLLQKIPSGFAIGCLTGMASINPITDRS